MWNQGNWQVFSVGSPPGFSTGGIVGLQSHRMSALVCRGLLIWAMLLFTANAEKRPVLKSYGQPVYPPIAKAARVEGAVTVEFLLDQHGTVASVSTLEGNAMLANAAESFVKTW